MKRIKFLRWQSVSIFISLSLFVPIALTAYASGTHCLSDGLAAQALAESKALGFRGDYKREGHFVRAGDLEHERLAVIYREQGGTKAIEGEVKRVGKKNLTLDLNDLTANTPEARALAQKLLQEGRKAMGKLYYFTSAAGLWSRGGGQVKALIPFNLKEILVESEWKRLLRAGDIATAASTDDILKAAQRTLTLDEEIHADVIAQKLKVEAKATLDRLIAQSRTQPKAMTPIDMKMVNVALNSERGNTHIPLDFWTSEQTHEPVLKYLDWFSKNFRTKQFHPDPKVDAEIKTALSHYLEESKRKGETHLFGFQKGLHPLDQKTLKARTEEAAIGEGAGMAKAYLDESGRTAELLKDHKTVFTFENIEVLTDLPLAMAAHERGGKAVSVVQVPAMPGYAGGTPYMVHRNGQFNMELHEMSSFPKDFELAEGNEYFNSNTIFQPLTLAPPKNIGFETKTAGSGVGKVIRAKVNAGDITHEAPTAGIGGRIGFEYENFKNYKEFGDNGQKMITNYQGIWARDVKP